MLNVRLKRSASWPSFAPLYDLHKEQIQNTDADFETSSSNSKSVVLIDWDGCLCDSATRILKRVALVGEELKRRHSGTYQIQDEKLKTPWTREFDDHMKYVFGEFSAEAANLYKEYINHPDIPQKRAFNGAREFIESIKAAKIPFAIVSNGTQNQTAGGIKDLGWDNLLDGVPIVTADEVNPNVKPNKVHFLKAFEKLGIPVDDKSRKIIVIGDGAESDMLGALKLSEEGFNVTALWTKINEPISLNLRSANNFQDVTSSVLEMVDRSVSRPKMQKI